MIKAYLDKKIKENNIITGVVLLTLCLLPIVYIILFGFKLLLIVIPNYYLFYVLHFKLHARYVYLNNLKQRYKEVGDERN